MEVGRERVLVDRARAPLVLIGLEERTPVQRGAAVRVAHLLTALVCAKRHKTVENTL